jgi:hypothetical protein
MRPTSAWPGVWRDRPGYAVAIVVPRLTVPVLSASDRLASETVAKP